VAKPLLPVRGRPLVEDLFEQLRESARIERFTVVSNARFAGQFRAWRSELVRRHPSLALDVIDDGAPSDERRLGAVRDLALALADRPPTGAVLVAAGDNLFRFRLGDFLDDHARQPRNLVLVCAEPDPARLRRSGVAVVSEGRIVRFEEKPAQPPSAWACPPLYVFQPPALARLPEFLDAHPEADPPGSFLAWLVEREPVFAHEMRGRRLDVGDVEGYRRAEAWLAEVERGGAG
jgi:glucose-1-phosphate thymidylyltransferase